MDILAESKAVALINAPAANIDLTDWLFTLTDKEYQACSAVHIAGGSSFSEDGKRMSINVEQIADNLLIQHYVEETGLRDHCEVRSVSDSLSAMGHTKLGIIWSLKIKNLSAQTCELTNHVQVLATAEFKELLQRNNIPDIELVKPGMLQNLIMHNTEETPLFARDIERKANQGMWL